MASSRKRKLIHPSTSTREPSRAPHEAPADRWWWILVLVPVLFNAIWLTPELTSGVPSKNDSALQLLLVHAASDALREGSNPFDFWIPQLELGFPQFMYYQHLPHLAVVALHRLMLGAVELETVFHAVQYLLLVAFPITVAWSMRHMGFSAVASGFAGAAASLVSGNGRYGFEYNSYLWRGVGLFAQLWAMHLSFLTLACVVRTIRDGRGYIRTSVLFAALALSHLVYGYMMAVTAGLVVVIDSVSSAPWRRVGLALLPRAARLTVIGILAGLLASYMLWPFVQSSHDYLSSLPGLTTRYGSIGGAAGRVIRARMLDYDRLPILTLLTGVGLVAAVVRRGPLRLLACTGLVMWLALYLGRPLLQSVGVALPGHGGAISFRFVGAVELFALLVIGLAGEAIWDLIGRIRVLSSRVRPAIALVVLGALLTPAILERSRFYAGNRQLVDETRAALAADVELKAVLSNIGADSGATYAGRVYAGPRRGWGGKFMVGPSLRVFDVLNAHRMNTVGNPYQGLALNSGLLFNLRDADAGLLDAFDIRTVVTPAINNAPSFFQPVFKTTRYAVWRVPSSGLAHYVAITARRSAANQRELYIGASDWFVSNAPRAHEVTRWDYPSGRAAERAFTPIARCADGGRIIDETVSSQRVTLVAECATAGAMALKMSYHPNWRVRIDSADVATYMVSPSFIGFDVPAGRHRIDAQYVATPSKLPLLVLGVGALVAAIVVRRRLDEPAAWMARRSA